MPAQRILIIKHGALGDVVLAMGTMKRLRELHPEAHITLMTMGMFVPMAEQLGVFDDFIVDNRLPYWKLGATWRAVRSIVKGNFDGVRSSGIFPHQETLLSRRALPAEP